MMKKINEKDYRLWWEFLRRSDNYKEFCEAWMIYKRSRGEDRAKNRKLLSDKFWPGRALSHLMSTYFAFGPVHSYSFKEWWKWKYKRLKETNSTYNGGSVQFINEPESFFPSLPDSDERKGIYSSYLFLAIDTSIDGVEKIVKSLIVKKRKTIETKNAAFQKARYSYPSTRIDHDALNRYLKVYDLWTSKIVWKDIATEIYPNAKGKWENIKRHLHSDLEKAKKIIKHTEYGYFPGPYDRTNARRMKAKKT